MLPPPPAYRDRDDIVAFAATPLSERLGGRDLVAMIGDAAKSDAGRVAISYRPGGKADGEARVFTRGQFASAAASVAVRLAELGIGRSDVVASLLPNGPGTLAATLGTLSAAVIAPINTFLDAAQIRQLLADCRAKAVLLPRTAPAALAGMFNTLRSGGLDPALRLIEIDTETLGAGDGAAAALTPRGLPERVALFHTGGTTGLPKFVPLTAHNLAAAAVISQFGYGYRESDLVLCAMPMFHVGGLFACSLFPLACGAEVGILGPLGYRGDGVVAALPHTIAALNATVAVGPPTVMAQLADRPPDMTQAEHLRLFVSGAAALPRVIGEKLSAATGVPVVEPWGLTEATLAVTSGPRDGRQRQGSVGLALPYCSVKAMRTDASGAATGDCAADEIGVLAIHGPMVFASYENREPGDQPFLAEGWLDSGDLGRVDAEGFVWVTGRAKELIKRGGHGIDPSLIEDTLHAHPDVALAAAIGKPDSYAGELPVAYVQLRSGATASADDLIAFARGRITERAAIPKEIVLMERLPLTAIGKVHKQTLRIDITRLVAEHVVRQHTGTDPDTLVTAAPHPLHGLIVEIRAPRRHLDAIRRDLSAFAFHSTVTDIEEDKQNA